MLRGLEHTNQVTNRDSVDFADQRGGERTIKERAVVLGHKARAETREEALGKFPAVQGDHEGQVMEPHTSQAQNRLWCSCAAKRVTRSVRSARVGSRSCERSGLHTDILHTVEDRPRSQFVVVGFRLGRRSEMRNVGPLGELETAIMQVVWAEGTPISVRNILTQLNRERSLAYTTVITVAERLRHKGVLTRVRQGRVFLYEAAVSSDAFSASLMRQVLDSADSRSAALLNFAGRLTADEAAALRQALAETLPDDGAAEV